MAWVSGLKVVVDMVSAVCRVALVGMSMPLLRVRCNRVYALLSVCVAESVMSPRQLRLVPRCLMGVLSDVVWSLVWVCVGWLYVSMVCILAWVGNMYLYDQAMLLNEGGGVCDGMLVIMPRHFLAFRPNLVTMEKAPPWLMWCCKVLMACFVLLADMYRLLSSQ